MKIAVETQYNKEQIIQTTKFISDYEDPLNILAREVVSLRENGIREALIKLGWTPPCDHKNTISIYENDGRDLFRCCQCNRVCGSDRQWHKQEEVCK